VADLVIGSEVAGYRLDAPLARGGMGVVYRATHLGLQRPVALKVIARELADRDGFRERFLRESRLAASLDHPSVVPVYDSREVDGELFVAMRLIGGGDLRGLIDREGPLEPGVALALLGQVADALDAAHAAGIVHRDVKPHNVLVEGDRAYLSDFGLAKAVDESGGGSGASVVGTAAYMSPEQWRGEAVGPPADVYSLGCVLYETVTGVVPYARRADDTEPELPSGLEAAIERATAPRPEDRYPSAGELIAAAGAGAGSASRPTQVLSAADRRRTAVIETSTPSGRPRTTATAVTAAGATAADATATDATAIDRTATAPDQPARSGDARRGTRRRPGPRTLALALGALAILAAAAVAAVLLLPGGDSPTVADPVAIGAPPLRIAAGSEKIWVVSEGDGTLSRIDAATDRVIGTARPLGQGIAGVTVGGGSVWVTDSRTGELLRVDDETGAVTQRIAVGGRPGPLAYGGGRVWVADESGAGITAVNAKGGRVVRRDLPPHAAPLRLAVGAGGLWVSSAETASVRRIDLGTFAAGTPILVGRGPAGVTVAAGLVWVANARSGTVTRVDPSLGSVTGSPIAVGAQPGGIDGGTSAVWVAVAGEDAVRRLALDSGEPDGDPIAVGPEPGAVAVGETAVWVVDNGNGTVTRIEP
jgi:DNA-binding beta-propeller fold protein YncE/predicted Ser/Thr protein kinase